MHSNHILPIEIATALTDPTAFADRDAMNESLKWMRANMPVGMANVDGFPPFWVLSKHADVSEASRRTDLFNNTSKPLILLESENIVRQMELTDGNPNAYQSMLSMDDPLHRKHRALFEDWFHPRKVKALEDRVRTIAVEFVDQMAKIGPECDFSREIAALYPLRIIMDVLGVPRKDEQMMLDLADVLFSDGDPDANVAGEVLKGAELAEFQRQQFDGVAAYFAELTQSRVDNPANDVASILSQARVDGEPLDPRDTLGHYLSFATAGHHTSSATLAGVFWALCEQPGIFDKVKADPKLITALIDETLRWLTPAKHFMRGCVKDTVIGGQEIKTGDWVYLSYQSANFDEDVFPDPLTFRLDRKPNKHFSFGTGPHICILEEALQRIDHVEFAAPPTLMHARWVQGPKDLKIRYKMT
jgi:cytochrome P450